MPQIFSILEYTDQTGDVLAVRLPADGAADIEWGAQLVVRESQMAMLLKDGQLVQTFNPGRYTLDTANLPILGKFATGLIYGKGNTPFKAEVYFVSRHLLRELRWGTPEPIYVVDPVMGQMPVRAHGRFAVQVSDPLVFAGRMVGTRGIVRGSDIENYLREQYLVSALTDGLASLGKPMVELPRHLRELAGGVKALLANDFASLGLSLVELSVNAVTPSGEYESMMSDSARSLSGSHAKARGTQMELEAKAAGQAALRDAGSSYAQVTQADAFKAMAEKPTGAGGATDAGMNAGLQLGTAMAAAQMMRDAMTGGAAATPAATPVVPVSTTPPPGVDPVAKLKQLKELLDLGAITQEEFDAKKKEYLRMI